MQVLRYTRVIMRHAEIPVLLMDIPLPRGVFAHQGDEIKKKVTDTLTSGAPSQTADEKGEARRKAQVLRIKIDMHEKDEKEVEEIKKELETPALIGRQTHKLRMRLVSAEHDRDVSNRSLGEFAEPHENTKLPFFSIYTVARFVYRLSDILGR